MTKPDEDEVRFAFGKNWKSFLELLNEDRIREAEKSLREFLGEEDLRGKKFLDIGSGSGLFSLAARRLGAQVCSFDYDEQAVDCARTLKHAYFRNDPDWTIMRGSVLDRSFMEGLGKFDVCYSWGVLHHTGHLWQALYNAQLPLGRGGAFFLGIYNDQGIVSECWRLVKKTYCSSGMGRLFVTASCYTIFFLAGLVIDVAGRRNPLQRYREHKKYRGMSLVHDWKDWIGGYPYEPASRASIVSYMENLDMKLLKEKPTSHGFGNNQFLFFRPSDGSR